MASLIQGRVTKVTSLDRYPFHMPGHKGKLRNSFTPDVTELPGLDNLHNPKGLIALSQARVAAIYRVPRTFFLVNGTSIGLMAGLMALIGPGERVLIERNCHKAVIAGLVHSGAMPVFIGQEYCPHNQIWLPPSLTALKEALALGGVKAAIFTNPNYMGLVPELGRLIGCCREQGVRTLVDEAHGAHLVFSPDLPPSAASLEADLVVQSAHKTLWALTQSAWLHCLNQELTGRLQQILNIFHTTSPSYPLLASLEEAALRAVHVAPKALPRLRMWLNLLRQSALKAGLGCWSSKGRDWTKLVLEARQSGSALLRSRGVYHELSMGRHMLFYTTMEDGLDTRGLKALIGLLPQLASLPPEISVSIEPPPPIRMALFPREAWLKPGRKVPIAQLKGQICREILAPYPPGTMVALPGQLIDGETKDYLQMLHSKRVISAWLSVI
jgi:lysine decarboxylase